MSNKSELLIFCSYHYSSLAEELKDILSALPEINVYINKNILNINENVSFSFYLKSFTENRLPDLIFVVVSSESGEDVFNFIHCIKSVCPLIAVIKDCRPNVVMELLKKGIKDFVTIPLREADIIPRIWRLLQKNNLKESCIDGLREKLGMRQIIGENPLFLEEINKIPIIARCDTSVLINGETGTGKELCARSIHYLSLRATKPFIPVNCGAIPAELLENELFGHVQGAFTGAVKTQSGLIYEAEGGTLFLDEIDCLPFQSQVKILRLLQEKEYRQLGSTKVRQANVRIIAATNNDLESSVKNGSFRKDLYYRLNVIPLKMPSLRERRSDIPILARHFLSKYCLDHNCAKKEFTEKAMQKLVCYEWPGNVRELENIIERAVIFTTATVIDEKDIMISTHKDNIYMGTFKSAKESIIAQFEKDYIKWLLSANNGNITKAAKAADKNRRAFWELIRKYNIDVSKYRFETI